MTDQINTRPRRLSVADRTHYKSFSIIIIVSSQLTAKPTFKASHIISPSFSAKIYFQQKEPVLGGLETGSNSLNSDSVE